MSVSFTWTPIGTVQTDIPDEEVPRRRREMLSTIVVDPRYAAGLEGVEAYSHLIVLFWMHRAPPPASLVYPPHGGADETPRGAFALRARNRPNPVGLAVVDLVAREGSRLHVRRLDAFDGTPVLDIKPYDYYDVFTDIRVPAWSNSARNRART
ncbi:MAG: tRNA (N6-threonylcarbamoyladenosine(37)-N6)-methyltransferase TrmO [Gammaproteobacteria bacterium]